MAQFRLTGDHLKLLRQANVGWQQCEAGAPEIDPKRPYGNGQVERDVAAILGWPVPDVYEPGQIVEYANFQERCFKIHRETETALQIVLSCGAFETGLYRRTDHRSWKRVGD